MKTLGLTGTAFVTILAASLTISLTTTAAFAADGPPPWAYGFTGPASGPATPAPPAAPVTDTSQKSLPGSKLTPTRAQISNRFGPADWYPEDHPVMPRIVRQGKEPNVWACSLCHYPNGKGRPENAPVTGYPTAYFIQQMKDFQNDNRKSSDPRKPNTSIMVNIAKGMTDVEIEAAAQYFGSMKWTPWIKVQESETAPKTHPAGGMFITDEGEAKEPLGDRIIETPVDGEGTEILRNPRSGFIAYVPVGSLKKGEALVKTGASKTIQCSLCHGADLKGSGPVPGIVGRSPSYLTRQLYDMQSGMRRGEWTPLMKPVVEKLDNNDLLNITAYLASLQP